MLKPLIASALALSIALSGIAAPARAASGQDVAKVLAGAATLYVLSRAIRKNRNKNSQPARAIPEPIYEDTRPYYGNQQPYYQGDRNRQCLRQKLRNGRWVTYKDKQCLKRYNNQRRVEKPRECLRKRWTRDGWVKYYDRRCLSRKNYRASNDDEHAYERDNRRRRDHD